jgi:hypothetical protein
MTGAAGQAGVLPRALMAGAASRPWAVVIALTLPLAAFWFTRHHGLNLQDESFLWYGAQRVLAGELPLRDFQSEGLAPEAARRTSTSPGPGARGASASTFSTSGPPVSCIRIA